MSTRPSRGYSQGSRSGGRPRSSSYAAVNGNGYSAPQKGSRKRWIWAAVALVIVACAVAIPVGVVYGTKNNGNNQNDAAVASAAGEGSGALSSAAAQTSAGLPSSTARPTLSSSTTASSSSSSSRASSTGRSSGSSSPSTTASSAAPSQSVNVAAKTKWDWTVGKNTAVGIALGNWLVLERWMDEDWFTQQSSETTWDEWGFTQLLGDRAQSVLEDHWNSWVTDSDLDTIAAAGVNTLRIPTGYWMWIPTLPGEPYVTQGQQAQLDRILAGAYARNIYVVITLHGLPGSQNGEQESGHNTTNPTFYQPLNQARADATMTAVVDYIANSPYWSIISGIEACNEPRPYTPEQFGMLRAYYERSYDAIQTLGNKAPAMMFADGFASGNKFAYWFDFAAARVTSPPSLIYTDHPYPGFFPAQTNQANILAQTCTDAAQYAAMPVPVCITEWSLRTGIQEEAFDKQYYIQQLTAWSYYGGSIFWSIRALNSSNPVLADPVGQYQYSFETLLQMGSIALPSSGQSAVDFVNSLGSPCGSAPAQAASDSPPTATNAAAAEASASQVDGLTSSIDNAALTAAQAFGYAGLGLSATPTGGSAAALQTTYLGAVAPASARLRAKRRHATLIPQA